MYFGLLRISEVTAGTHAVKANDIHISANKKKFLLILRTSKMHWTNVKPQLIKITATKHKNPGNPVESKEFRLPCPYQLLRDFAEIRGRFRTLDEPFFVFSDKTPVTAQQAGNCLKTTL